MKVSFSKDHRNRSVFYQVKQELLISVKPRQKRKKSKAGSTSNVYAPK